MTILAKVSRMLLSGPAHRPTDKAVLAVKIPSVWELTLRLLHFRLPYRQTGLVLNLPSHGRIRTLLWHQPLGTLRAFNSKLPKIQYSTTLCMKVITLIGGTSITTWKMYLSLRFSKIYPANIIPRWHRDGIREGRGTAIQAIHQDRRKDITRRIVFGNRRYRSSGRLRPGPAADLAASAMHLLGASDAVLSGWR